MLRFNLFFLFLFTGCVSLFAQYIETQDASKAFSKANNLMLNQNFQQAIKLLILADSLDPNNANINFKLGYCYLNSLNGKNKAEAHLEKAVKNISQKYKDNTYKERGAPTIAWFYLGQAYHFNNKFDQAIEAFNKFREFTDPKDLNLAAEINRQIEYCINGKMLSEAPIAMEVKNIGKTINSAFPEYAPVISADESVLIFTSRRNTSTGGKIAEDGGFFEDIYISYNINGEWTEPKSIGENINTSGHEATIGLSVDGQQLFIYKDDNGDGNIYYSKLDGDTWQAPIKLSDNINSKSWESHASISSDGNTLYFTSNRKGGYGGRDIYFSRKLPNGEWGLPINMGPKINTPYDEEGPFIHPDNRTLFFSSKGHNSMGGFDVFISLKDENGNWSQTMNMGYPLNSSDDDVFYVLSADGKRAYYSSFKDDSYGEKDIYVASFIEFKEKPLALVKGTVKDAYGNVPKDVVIVVSDNETGEVVGTYIPNSKTGNYLFILPPGANYNISYEAEGYLFKSENIDIPEDANYFQINKAIELEPIQIGSKIILNNIFFDFDKATLRDISKTELEKLTKLMEINSKISVEISGHTDAKGNEDYNLKLSQDRAQAVVNYLINRGIDKNRMIAKGYGKSKPIADNYNADGSENLEGMQLNRRVELKVISLN
jgi:outer membrane protein OmpA-like peptidoglycan-associated protein/tetratricopeptide (TPR) repeat protein